MALEDDVKWMALAIELARRGEGRVEPNPMVGCVIVLDGAAVAEGFHRNYGDDHAEVDALKQLPASVRGATLYVTLEPCCHHGKTPPCSQAIIDSQQVSRVVVAQADPFPDVSGGGITSLRASGIEVTVGVCEAEAKQLNAPYLRLVESNRPWVHAKWAMTLDGRIATSTHSSQWISNDDSRSRVHEIRGRMDAIIVGSGTALHDDPMLTARPSGPRVARRVVMDHQAKLSPDSKLVQTAAETPCWVFVSSAAEAERVDRLTSQGVHVITGLPDDPAASVRFVLSALAAERATNVLVEGGGALLGSFFDARVVDEVHIFMAAKIVGGRDAVSPVAGNGISSMNEAFTLEGLAHEIIGSDVYVHGRLGEAGD